MKIKTPFFIFNPKSYLYGEELLKLAKIADEFAEISDFSIFVTCPFTDIRLLSENTKNIIVTAQNVEGLQVGRGMGHVFVESIFDAGAKATFINHAENPMRFVDIEKSIKRCKEFDIKTIVCADSINEAKALAHLNPNIILCEPTELIGTGVTSDQDYVHNTISEIKSVNDGILIMQAAGISNENDVYNVIKLGADGTGCTSGIIKANNPEEMLKNMLNSIIKFQDEVSK